MLVGGIATPDGTSEGGALLRRAVGGGCAALAELFQRHFEMLSNEETAQVLGLRPSAASNRHMRALKRLKEIMAEATGPDGSSPGP